MIVTLSKELAGDSRLAVLRLKIASCVVGVMALLGLSTGVFAVEVGDTAPDIELKGLVDGKPISLKGLRGKVVFVDVWASWCPPCRLSLPLFNEVYKEIGAYGLEIIAVNVDSERKDGLGFIDKHPVDYLVAADPKGTVAQDYGLKGMPTSYLVDQKGKIAMIHEGFRVSDVAIIKKEMLKLLRKK